MVPVIVKKLVGPYVTTTHHGFHPYYVCHHYEHVVYGSIPIEYILASLLAFTFSDMLLRQELLNFCSLCRYTIPQWSRGGQELERSYIKSYFPF